MVASALAAYCLTGRQKIFWLGFATMWLLNTQLNQNSAPQFISVSRLFEGHFPRGYNAAVFDTIRTCGIMIQAIVAGLIGLYIYDNSIQKK
jgi:hypothetical protein